MTASQDEAQEQQKGTADGMPEVGPQRFTPIAENGVGNAIFGAALVILLGSGLAVIYLQPDTLPAAGGLGGLVLVGTFLAYLALHRLTVADRRERKRLERLGMTDFTTGVFNRRYIYSRLESEIEQVNRHGGRLAILSLDLDQFKRVNDKFGHGVGDWVLRRVTSVVQASLRSPDVLGRVGGDEFLVILPRTGPSGAQEAGERVVRTVEERTFRTPAGEKIGLIGISVGIASCPEDGVVTEELLAAADRALYKAKQTETGIYYEHDQAVKAEAAEQTDEDSEGKD